MEQTTTRVPALLDALYARLSAALDGWQVFDGPTPNQATEMDVMFIGWPDFDGTTVLADVQRTQGMGHRYTETYEVRCIFSVESGDEDNKPMRDRAMAGLNAVEAALQQDRGLGGVVDLVNVGPSQSWHQFQTENGTACELIFTIQARVTR